MMQLLDCKCERRYHLEVAGRQGCLEGRLDPPGLNVSLSQSNVNTGDNISQVIIFWNLNILSHGGHLEVWLWRRMLPGARISQRSHHLASHNLTNLKEVCVSGNPKAGIEQYCSGGWREFFK